MNKQLVCYALKKTSPTIRTKLHRELYGYTDISNHGKYSYKRPGLLAKTASTRITDAVIISPEKEASKIVKLLNKYHADIWIFSISEITS